jgi:hypothetical protein
MELPPFYAGQQVVVLRTVARTGTTYLTKNETRVIKDIRRNSCGTFPWIVDVGVEGSGLWRCPACGDTRKQESNAMWFESDLFMGLDSLKTVTFEKIEEAIPVGAN